MKVEDRVLALANSEVMTAAKVLDKCDGGLELTLDGDQVGGEPWLRPKKQGCTTCSRASAKSRRTPRSAEMSTLRAGGIAK